MALIPLLSREIEYSLSPRKTPASRVMPHEETVVTQMLAAMQREFRAVPFANKSNFENICVTHPIPTEVVRGVYHGVFGNFHREAVNPYWEVSHRICDDPFELAREIRRGEQLSGYLCRNLSTDKFVIRCFNAVSDRNGYKGKSAGMHDNFLITRDLFNRIFSTFSILGGSHIGTASRWLQDLASMRVLVSTVFGGEGKVGHECTADPAHYQISGRTDFIGYLAGGETTRVRGIINTRDESHANCVHWARLHCINGEGNRSPWSIILNTGMMAIFLAALADDEMRLNWYLAEPVEALHNLSRDLSLSRDIEVVMRKGSEHKTKKPCELILEIIDQLELYCAHNHVPSWCIEVVGEGKKVAEMLARGDPEGEAAKMLDWLIKRQFLKSFIEEKLGLDPENLGVWQHPRVQAVDKDYHRIDDSRLWRAICENNEVRDAEKYYAPYGEVEDESFHAQGIPGENRSYLLWYICQDPHLREAVYIYDWGEIILEKISILLEDPRKFGKNHLSRLLQGLQFDFSKKEDRLRFALLISEHAMMRSSFRNQQILTVHGSPRFCPTCEWPVRRYNQAYYEENPVPLPQEKPASQIPDAKCTFCLTGRCATHQKSRRDVPPEHDAPDDDFIRLAGYHSPREPEKSALLPPEISGEQTEEDGMNLNPS